MPAHATLVDLVDSLERANPEHGLVLVDPRGRETRLTWRQLHRRIRRHAGWLAAQGIRQGDRVVVCPTSEPDIVISFLALVFLGAVPLSVSGTQLGQAAGSQLPFVASLIELGGCKGVFSQPELIAGNESANCVDPDKLVDPVPSTLDLEDEPPAIEPARVDPQDLAIVQFSSGSTSHPIDLATTACSSGPAAKKNQR